MANYTPNETRLFQQAVGSSRSIGAATCRGVEAKSGGRPASWPTDGRGPGFIQAGRSLQGTRRAKCAGI
jgi:hypothetical protein